MALAISEIARGYINSGEGQKIPNCKLNLRRRNRLGVLESTDAYARHSLRITARLNRLKIAAEKWNLKTIPNPAYLSQLNISKEFKPKSRIAFISDLNCNNAISYSSSHTFTAKRVSNQINIIISLNRSGPPGEALRQTCTLQLPKCFCTLLRIRMPVTGDLELARFEANIKF